MRQRPLWGSPHPASRVQRGSRIVPHEIHPPKVPEGGGVRRGMTPDWGASICCLQPPEGGFHVLSRGIDPTAIAGPFFERTRPFWGLPGRCGGFPWGDEKILGGNFEISTALCARRRLKYRRTRPIRARFVRIRANLHGDARESWARIFPFTRRKARFNQGASKNK